MTPDLTTTVWRKSSRSSTNGNCVEVGCLHDAAWRKSSRSATNGNCVETATVTDRVAIRDSKLDTTGDFPVLVIDQSTWRAMLTGIHTGEIAS